MTSSTGGWPNPRRSTPVNAGLSFIHHDTQPLYFPKTGALARELPYSFSEKKKWCRGAILCLFGGSAKCTKGAFEWKGSWIGVDSPAAKNKSAPESRFSKVKCCFPSKEQCKQEGTKKGSCQEDCVELTFKVTKGKGWLLDDMLYHKDHAQDIYFRTNKAKTVLVGATGSNDFGSFLSLGIWWHCQYQGINAGKEFTLTLGRRYLEEGYTLLLKANAEIRECLKIFSFQRKACTTVQFFSFLL